MKNILFLNHKQKQCGVYQYGYRSTMILANSKKYNFLYCEVENEIEFSQLIQLHNPYGVIYNYHPSTMSWVNNSVLNKYKDIFHFGIHHEGHQTMDVWFDYYIMTDSTFTDIHNRYSVHRPLFENIKNKYNISRCISIGSFGFGFKNKGFVRLVEMVNNEFDIAELNLHIPFAYYGDMYGQQAKEIISDCQKHITKPGITLNISHNFFTDEELLYFLSSNDINAFLYDEMPNRGLSSVIDYALSVKKPIAITNTYMFRHISDCIPSICIENNTLRQIISHEENILNPYRERWSNTNFIEKYEYIISKTEKQV